MNEFIPWAEKYRPKSTKEVVGQNLAVEKALDFVKNFRKEKTKALLLYGPPGNGKTSIVQAIANELNYELIEMNTSDFRTADSIKEKIGHAVTQQSLLFKKGKLILIDEIDGIYGNADRGGLPAIYKVLEESNYPIILTANDPWKSSLKTLRQKCALVQMKRVDIRSEVNKLDEIAKKEGIEVEEDVIHEIARLSQGDLRAAINDLQTICQGRKVVRKEDLKEIEARIKEVQIFDTLLAIFKSKDKKIIFDAFNNSDKSPDEILLWLVENIPKEYEKPGEIAEAFNYLSRADVFKGRIIHNQAWGLQSFVNELMCLGVAFAKREKYHKFTRYSPPGILVKMGRSKFARASRDKVAEKIGKVCHCSKKRAVEQFPYFSIILKKKELEIELEKGEVEYLKKYT